MKRIISLITIFTLLLSLGATGSFALDKTKEADKLYKQALQIQKSKPKDAIKLMDKAILYCPENPEYYYQRGFIEPNLGKAFLDYNRAIVLNPDKYFELCFGGDSDGVTYNNNLDGFSLSTSVWDLYETSTVAQIKKKLASFKGNRVKEARAILDEVTDGAYSILEASDADQKAFVDIGIIVDYKNEVESNESFATMMSNEMRYNSKVSKIGKIINSEIGTSECSYFDYLQTVDNQVLICRNYTLAYDYYVINIALYAEDQEHFDAALEDFIDTYQ